MNRLVDDCKQLTILAHGLGFDSVAGRFRDLAARAEQNCTHVVVVGEFNRGKSTLVNAMVGQALLPVDIVPTTAAIWTLRSGPSPSVTRIDKDGTRTSIAGNEGSFQEISADGQAIDRIHRIDAVVTSLALGDDVVVVDTPGVNDINQQRADITYGYLEAADVAVMVLDASTPFTRSELEFIEGQILAATLGKMVFVLNKADRLDEDELEEAAEFAEERVETLIGTDVPLVVTDGGRILQARIAGNDAAAEQWGWGTLCSTLRRVAREAGGGDTRAARHESTRDTLVRSLRGEIGAEIEALSQDEAARLEAEQAWALTLADHRDRLDALLIDAKLHGRDRLKTMLTGSMQHEVRQWVEQRQVAIASMPDVSVYVKDALPRELQLFAKKWYERRQPDIEKFVAAFNGHLGREFQRQFGGSVVPATRWTESNSTAISTRIERAESGGPPEAVLETALPAAAYLALAFLGTGPFAIVGLVGGGLMARRLSAQRKAAEKGALLHDLENAVLGVMEEPLRRLHQACDEWFAVVEDQVRARFEAGVNQRESRTASIRQLTDEQSQLKRERALKDALEQLNNLEVEWDSTSST